MGEGGKPPGQSQEDRDLQQLKKRRAQSQPKPTTVDSSEADTPVEHFAREDPTRPIVLIEREHEKYQSDTSYREEMNAINERYESDPAFRAFWNMWRRQRRESNRTLGALGSTTLENHAETQRLAELANQLGSIDTWKREVDVTFRIVKWILGFVIAATLGVVGFAATKIYLWGVSNGEIEIRLQHLEKEADHPNPSMQEIIENLRKGKGMP